MCFLEVSPCSSASVNNFIYYHPAVFYENFSDSFDILNCLIPKEFHRGSSSSGSFKKAIKFNFDFYDLLKNLNKKKISVYMQIITADFWDKSLISQQLAERSYELI